MNPKEIQQQIKRLSSKIHQTAEQLNNPVSKIEIDILRKLCMEQYDLILMLSAGKEEQEAYNPPVAQEVKQAPAPVEPAAKEKEQPRRTDNEYEELMKEYQDLLAQHKKNLEESARAKAAAEAEREKSKKEAPKVTEKAKAENAQEEKTAATPPAKEKAFEPVAKGEQLKIEEKDAVKEPEAETGEPAAETEIPAEEEIIAEDTKETQQEPAEKPEKKAAGAEEVTAEKEEPVKPEDFYNKTIVTTITPANGTDKKEAGVKEAAPVAENSAKKEEPEEEKKEGKPEEKKEDKKEERKKEEIPADKSRPAPEKPRPPSVDLYKLEKLVAEEETVIEAVHPVGPVPVKKEESWKASDPKREPQPKLQQPVSENAGKQNETAKKEVAEVKPPEPEPVKSVKVPEEPVMDLNRKLGEAMQNKDLHTRLRETPIPDLKSAITINKKIAFMNNLFESSIDKYDNAIALLNSSQSLSTALQHLSGLRMAYNWGNENELAEELEELIRRRYS
jgi:chemotaxis protein histidine kinase CheA